MFHPYDFKYAGTDQTGEFTQTILPAKSSNLHREREREREVCCLLELLANESGNGVSQKREKRLGVSFLDKWKKFSSMRRADRGKEKTGALRF